MKVSIKVREVFSTEFMRNFVLSRSGQFFEESILPVGSIFCVAYLKHLVKLVIWNSREYIFIFLRQFVFGRRIDGLYMKFRIILLIGRMILENFVVHIDYNDDISYI